VLGGHYIPAGAAVLIGGGQAADTSNFARQAVFSVSTAKLATNTVFFGNLSMRKYPDADLTLPGVAAAIPVNYQQQDLVLTIVFHPDISRIGEAAVVPRQPDGVPWILGRRSPAFGRGTSLPNNPLRERHVSRQALALVRTGESLSIRRLPDSSRTRLDGRELEGAVELEQEQLRRGVPLLMGHTVVLLLRLGPRAEQDAATCITALLGSSAYMSGLKQQITRAGATDMDVLIRGETGTGKELVAAAIHRASRRSESALVSVNMAAIPPGLAAATLFGSARGAFTGASTASEGYFQRAEGGTLFLDEIGDTPADVQPQLLRALQQREIQAVGGSIRRVDVRVVSATDAAVQGEGCDFKAALRHRLGACEVVLLPLREHPEDIGELLLDFLAAACEETGVKELLPGAECSGPQIASWAELFHSFLRYEWPGNVRELVNFARQVVLASHHRLTLPDHIGKALAGSAASCQDSTPGIGAQARRKMADIEEAEFDSALEQNRYEVANTARQLAVSRQSVYRRIDASARHRLAHQVPLPELERVLAEHGGNAAATAEQLRVSASALRARLRDAQLPWF
jgi:DNA-binding NtrC family response regulator